MPNVAFIGNLIFSLSCNVGVIAAKLAPTLHNFFLKVSTMKTTIISRTNGTKKVYVPVSQMPARLEDAKNKLTAFVAANCKPENFPVYDFDLFAEYMQIYSVVKMRYINSRVGTVPVYRLEIPTFGACLDYGILPECSQSKKFYYAVLEEYNFFLF
jgi:hypothetical protein